MKKLTALFLSLVLVIGCFCVFAVADDATEVKIPVYVINPEYYYEGCAAIYTPERGEVLGIEGQNFAYWTVLAFEADEATGGYKCTYAGTDDGTDKTNTAIPANGFVIGANTGNNWPDLFSKPDAESQWFYNEANSEGIPYKDCPNYNTEAIKAIVQTMKTVKVGDIFYLEGISLENSAINTNASDEIHYYDDTFETNSFLTSVKPTSTPVEESSEAPAEQPSEAPVTTEKKNLALDATVLNSPEYVVTEGQWPSDYSGKVNDGVIGEYGKYGNQWAAFYHNNSDKDNFDGVVGEIVLDFGAKKDFTSFRTNIWGGQPKGDGIASIEKVEIFVSNDNQNWFSVGTVTEGLEVEGAWAEVEKAASGRYVKYAYTKSTADGKGGSFLFISECEAYGAGSASETSTETPSEKPVDPAPTSDSGIAALAVISVLAIAGAVIVKKSR